jgi:hypothetical protein
VSFTRERTKDAYYNKDEYGDDEDSEDESDDGPDAKEPDGDDRMKCVLVNKCASGLLHGIRRCETLISLV